MSPRSLREALAQRVLSLAGRGQLEALVHEESLALTRFTHNAIHQNLAEHDVNVRVRALVDGRTGVAATNDLSDASLAATIARARAIAALAPPDPALPGLAFNDEPAAPPGAYSEATASASPADRAGIAAATIAAAERAGLWAAGYVTTASTGLTIANTAGTLVSFDGTTCGLNVKANGPDASGFAERHGNDVAALDGTALGTLAAQKALAGARPASVAPGAWTVILEPAAFGELISHLTDHFSAQTVDEGSSFLADGLERAYMGPNVTIADDFAHPLLAGCPFDFEGYPTRRLPLVAAGVAKHVVTDAAWAKRLNLANTGHGLPAPSSDGPQARHVVVSGGTKTTEQLIAETAHGLLITRLWYIRSVDRRKTIVTGMTRDGTFEIRDGQLTRAVKNLRFNQSILASLAAPEFSHDQHRTTSYDYQIVVPTAKLPAFHFTSTTDF
jgi:predicted Zn-dependent protease